MCVKAANSVELFDGIKSQIGDVAYPEVCVEGGKWVPMSAIRFEDLQAYMQLRIPVAVPPSLPELPVRASHHEETEVVSDDHESLMMLNVWAKLIKAAQRADAEQFNSS
jgi:hypothetical protein